MKLKMYLSVSYEYYFLVNIYNNIIATINIKNIIIIIPIDITGVKIIAMNIFTIIVININKYTGNPFNV
jgi:hypothetical protein